MRRRSARCLSAVLHSRGCWQLGARVMQHLGSAQRPPLKGRTGGSLQCTVTRALLGTAAGRRQQMGPLSLASLAILDLLPQFAVLLMASPCFTGHLLQHLRTQSVYSSQPAALLQGRAVVSRQISV